MMKMLRPMTGHTSTGTVRQANQTFQRLVRCEWVSALAIARFLAGGTSLALVKYLVTWADGPQPIWPKLLSSLGNN